MVEREVGKGGGEGRWGREVVDLKPKCGRRLFRWGERVRNVEVEREN